MFSECSLMEMFCFYSSQKVRAETTAKWEARTANKRDFYNRISDTAEAFISWQTYHGKGCCILFGMFLHDTKSISQAINLHLFHSSFFGWWLFSCFGLLLLCGRLLLLGWPAAFCRRFGSWRCHDGRLDECSFYGVFLAAVLKRSLWLLAPVRNAFEFMLCATPYLLVVLSYVLPRSNMQSVHRAGIASPKSW